MIATIVLRTTHEFTVWLAQKGERSGLAFRGQSNANRHEHLVPGIDRGLELGVSHIPYQQRLAEQEDLQKKFHDDGERYFVGIERRFLDRIQQGDRLAGLTVMQHFGGPTRLLDWTHSVSAAAYFACIGNWNSEGAIYWFDLLRLEERLQGNWKPLGFLTENDINLNDIIFRPDAKEFIACVHLSIPFARAVAQKGLFTVASRLGLCHDTLLEETPPGDRHLGKVLISAGIKREVLAYLGRLAIDASTLQFAGADIIGTGLTGELQTKRSPKSQLCRVVPGSVPSESNSRGRESGTIHS